MKIKFREPGNPTFYQSADGKMTSARQRRAHFCNSQQQSIALRQPEIPGRWGNSSMEAVSRG
jgi:hypothetical protein